jgi:hypothetical protein
MWLKWEEVREVWISVLWCTSETPETPILIPLTTIIESI